MRIGDVVIVVRNPRTLSFLGHVVYAVNLCEKRQFVMHFRNVIVWFQVVDPVIPEMAPTYYSVIFPENCIKMKKTGLRRRGHVSLTVFNQDQYLDLGQKINSPPNDYLWLFLQLGTRNITNKIMAEQEKPWCQSGLCLSDSLRFSHRCHSDRIKKNYTPALKCYFWIKFLNWILATQYPNVYSV